MGCLLVYLYVAVMVVASIWTDAPSWIWVPHVAVMLLAIAVQVGTLRDIATRGDWTRAQRVSWRNWIWGFNILAVLAYFWTHLDRR